VDTVVARDTALERQVRLLEAKVVEKDARIDALQTQLEAAQTEVAQLLKASQGNRAEATTAIAEAEVAVRSARGVSAADVNAARGLLRRANAEFADTNYAGALYFADQAKKRVQNGRRPKPGTPAAKPRANSRSP
jgi:peptidoglycan hydrolase CwlO-like protein